MENQSLRNIEILAINDCSTDNSLKLLKTLSKEDKRIKIINNDRNHGLLYSRAMGILNSSGEYLMNLDPDDKLVSNNNLKLLYKTAKYKDFDFIMYKLKRIALNSKEKNIYDYLDEIQLNATDDHITNKLIKKDIFLKAFNDFKDEIFGQKWNYHEDNIWSILVRNYSNSSKILNKFIYLYKRNEESLNMKRGNIIDLKNMAYRFKKLKKINYNVTISKFKHHFYTMIKNYHLLKSKEVKNNIIQLSVMYFNYIELLDKKYINLSLNKISENKIIIFNKQKKNSLTNYSKQLYKLKVFLINSKKRFIFINALNKTILKNSNNYIFRSDVLVLFNISINDNDVKNIILNSHKKNKIILF